MKDFALIIIVRELQRYLLQGKGYGYIAGPFVSANGDFIYVKIQYYASMFVFITFNPFVCFYLGPPSSCLIYLHLK